LRRFLVRILFFLRIPHLFHFINRKRGNVPILLFHDINPVRNELTGSMTPDEFEKVILFLKNHYQIKPLNSNSKTLCKQSCYISFDDGMYSFLKYALPIIERHKVPVTIFIPSDAVSEGITWVLKYFQATSTNLIDAVPLNKDSANEIRGLVDKLELDISDDFRLMTWDELQRVSPDFVSIQSHTKSHVFLSQSSEDELIDELRDSQIEIEDRLSMAVDAVSYPFGDYDGRILGASQTLYKKGYITGDRLVTDEWINQPMIIPRIHISHGDIFELYLRSSGFISFVKKFAK
jgi:peptidoglycan/xylan/chitin deacetylase (PgdA/CDA1 family)